MTNQSMRKRREQTGNQLTIGSELNRLLGGPWRALFTLALVVTGPLLGLMGGLDWLNNQLYALSHRGATDPRRSISFLKCLGAEGSKLCQKVQPFGSVRGEADSTKLQLWPFEATLNPPYLYGLFVLLGVLAFVSIGNPRFGRLGATLTQAVGMNRKSKSSQTSTLLETDYYEGERAEDQGQLVDSAGKIPTLSDPLELRRHWLVGRYIARLWNSAQNRYELIKPPPAGVVVKELSKKKKKKPAALPTDLYWLGAEHLCTNLAIVAPPGSGKTFSVFHPLLNYSRRAGQTAALFFDSKGDDYPPTSFDYNFDLNADPQRSIKINLFAGATPEQAGERLAEALIPQMASSAESRYFSEAAKIVMASLVSSHHAEFGEYPSLTRLLLYLNEPNDLEGLKGRIVSRERRAGQDQRDGWLRLIAGLKRVEALAANTKTDPLGSLVHALMPLTGGSAARLLVANPIEGDKSIYTVEDLIRRPHLVRLGLPVADHPQVGPIVGRLLLAQFTLAVLSPRCNRSILKLAAVDEAHNFVTPYIAKGMAQARSNRGGYVLAFQTLSQIGDKNLLDTIFAASGTKVVMAGVGDEDAERFSRTFGEVELYYTSYSESEQRTKGRSSGTSRMRGQEFEMMSSGSSGTETRSSISSSTNRNNGSSTGAGSNEQRRLRRRFLPSEIRGLPRYHAIIEASDTTGRRWPAQVIDMATNTVQRLEQAALESTQKEEEEKVEQGV